MKTAAKIGIKLQTSVIKHFPIQQLRMIKQMGIIKRPDLSGFKADIKLGTSL